MGASETLEPEAINAPTERKTIRPRSARCRSCSPIGERRIEAAAIAWSSRGRQRTLEARNRSSISRGVHSEAGAVAAEAEAESAWPSDERWSLVERSSSSGRRSSVRGVRQISPPPLADRGRWGGLVIGTERPRSRSSVFSYPRTDVDHGRDIQWVSRDQQRGSGENTLSGSSIQRGVGRVGAHEETDAACERRPSRLMDGDAQGMTGVRKGMIWAAFAVSAIVVGRWEI